MKNILARIRRMPLPPPAAPGGATSSYFVSQFQDPQHEMSLMASWDARSIDLHTRPHDAAQGIASLVALFGRDPQLAQLGSAALAAFGGYLDYVEVDAGRQVIGQEEPGDFLLVVLEGVVVVERVQPDGTRVRLGESRAGDVLGEMSLLDAGARFSACTTLTSTRFAVLDAAALDRMMHGEPRLAAALLAWLARRLSLRLRQVSARLSSLLARE